MQKAFIIITPILLVLLLLVSGYSVLQNYVASNKQVPLDGSVNPYCFANGHSFTCQFTNLNSYPITACSHGVVEKNGSNGDIKITSKILCSGVLSPYETRKLDISWVGTRPTDICKDDAGFDWKYCTLDVVNHTEETIAAYRLKAAAK